MPTNLTHKKSRAHQSSQNRIMFSIQPETNSSNPFVHCIADEVESSSSFHLLANDIVCSRNNTAAHRNPGNKRYNDVIQTYGQHYQACTKRDEKTRLTLKVIQIVSEYGGRFVKFDEQTQQWTELDAQAKKEKVSHALRSVKKRPCLSKKQRRSQKKANSNSNDYNNRNNIEKDAAKSTSSIESSNDQPDNCASAMADPTTSLTEMMMMSPSHALAALPTTLNNFPQSLKRSPSSSSTSTSSSGSSLIRQVSEESQLNSLRHHRGAALETSLLNADLLDFDNNGIIDDDAISMTSVISALDSDDDDAIEVFQEWAS